MNIFTFSGNLGRDAETRFSKTGTGITNFSVPVKSGWGQNEKITWVKCTMFGKKDANEPNGLAQYLLKGKLVVVTGEMVMEEWEKDGQKHAMTCCVVRDIVLGSAKDEPSGSVKAPAQVELVEDDIPF